MRTIVPLRSDTKNQPPRRRILQHDADSPATATTRSPATVAAPAPGLPPASHRAAGRAARRTCDAQVRAPALAALGAVRAAAARADRRRLSTTSPAASVMSTDNAYVQADMVGVSTDVSGIVKEIDVTREPAGQAAGDVLFRLDDQPFRLALDARQCAARHRRVTISTRSRRTTATCRPRSSRPQADVAYYDAQFKRQQDARRQQLRPAGRPSTARGATCRPRSRSSPRSTSSSPASPPTSTATRMRRSNSTRATWRRWPQRDEAARQLDHTVVQGAVRRHRHQCALAAARQVSRRPRRPRSAWSRPTMSGSRPTRRKPSSPMCGPGQPVDGRRSTPIRASTGTAPSRASARPRRSSFSLLPAQNTSGNWVKVVQRIPMRVQHRRPARQAAAARRHERRGRRRYRPCARPAGLPRPGCSARRDGGP